VLPFDTGKVFAGENRIGRAALNLLTVVEDARKSLSRRNAPAMIEAAF
jgi:hypothetical protein